MLSLRHHQGNHIPQFILEEGEVEEPVNKLQEDMAHQVNVQELVLIRVV